MGEIPPYPDNMEPLHDDVTYVPRRVAGELHDGRWFNMFSVPRALRRRRVVATGIVAISAAEDIVRQMHENGPSYEDLPGNPDMREGGMLTGRVEDGTRQAGEEG